MLVLIHFKFNATDGQFLLHSDQVFILFLLNFKLDVMISEFLENFYCVVLKHFYIFY